MLAALILLGVTVIPFRRLGSEFMPPLNEGTLLYMPTAVPGMAVGEATRILQIQDRQLRKIPEVERVFGKAGQSETSTDPAPLSMFETVVSLKPPDQWRPGMTWDKIVAEMNANIKTPGMANIFWMPIQTRTEMLTTGFRSVLGIKVFGPDLAGIQDVAVQIEKTLTAFPNTRSVFAERTTGGYFLDFTVNREAAARYGLGVGDVNDVIESAIGGKTITTTVEGRERYPVNVRYARDFREDLDALKRVLVLHADRRAGADFHAGGHPVQDRPAVHPRRERPARRLRVHRPDHQRHRRLRARGVGEDQTGGSFSRLATTLSGPGSSST